MCWMCDHPNATREDYSDVLRTKMLRAGWAVQYVESDRNPFAYTVGLHDWGRPSCSSPESHRQGVPTAQQRHPRRASRSDVSRPESRSRSPDGPLVEIVEVDHPDAHMGWAIHVGGPDVRALQLVWADGRGRWPWSATFCDGRRRQPVLGLRTQNA